MKSGESRRHIRLWLLIAAAFTLLLSLTVGAIVLSYRLSLEDRYEEGLRRQLSMGLDQLLASGDPAQAAQSLEGQGIYALLVEAADRRILYHGSGGPPLSLGPKREDGQKQGRNPWVEDAALLEEIIVGQLGREDGSFFLSDEGKSPSHRLDAKLLQLCGRSGGLLYCLYLPVESTNAAVSLAVRYAAWVSLGVWAASLLLFYLLSKQIAAPHRKISDTAAQIARLDFSRRCPGFVTRELDEIGRSINIMADSLEANIQALTQANDRLKVELAERTRQQGITTELIANLSHDLKTPIAIISGYAEGLLEGIARSPEKQRTYYEMILRESGDMQAIVSKMLALSRLESGETPISPEAFDLAELLGAVLDSFQVELARRGIALEGPKQQHCPVYTDYECARQSVTNYVQNAVFHINNGNAIRVWLEDRGPRVRVCVANSSAPIPAEELPRLWDKLYRGDPARQRHNGETGLGLAIVKGNMDRLGCPYGCENDEAAGMVVFWLELPTGSQDGLPKEGPGR